MTPESIRESVLKAPRALTPEELELVLREADRRTVMLLYLVSHDSQERVLREALGDKVRPVSSST